VGSSVKILTSEFIRLGTYVVYNVAGYQARVLLDCLDNITVQSGFDIGGLFISILEPK